MPGGFTNFLENKTLEHIFITPYEPGALFIGLCTDDPTDSATGALCNEVPNAGSYTRAAFTTSDWELAGTPGIIRNSETIVFVEPTLIWGIVTHFVIVDAVLYGTGNVLIYGPLAQGMLIIVGSMPRFVAGSMNIGLE